MIEKITQSEIERDAVAALSDRPGAPGRYGTGGLSAGQIKAHFDKLALLAIHKLNELIDALHGAGAGDPLIDEFTTHAVSLSDDREHMPLSEWIGQVETLLGLDGAGGLPARVAALEALQVPEQTPAAPLLSGRYPDLVAGSAENLIGRAGDAMGACFTHRPTHDASDVGNGPARLLSLFGKTLVWNQLFSNDVIETRTVHGITVSKGADNTVHLCGTATAITDIVIYTGGMKIGHKYFVCAASDAVFMVYCGSVFLRANTCILTPTTNSSVFVSVDRGQTVDADVPVALIDLTEMFGAGQEPATPEAFLALFPQVRYAHCPRRLLHFCGTDLKTVGFNQWNEAWEQGGLDAAGQTVANGASFRCADPIPVFPQTAYYLRCAAANTVCYYDANMRFLGAENEATGDRALTTPAHCRYLRFAVTGATYTGGICLNLAWSGWRNGQYEPYCESTLSLPVTAYFEGGMKSVGAAYDELDFVGQRAVRRVGAVDLGTLQYTYGEGAFHARVEGKKPGLTNLVSARFETVEGSVVGTHLKMRGDQQTATVYLTDTDYTNPEAFRNAMRGVTLFYELETPEVTAIDHRLFYSVDDFGTEQLLPENGEIPITAPLTGRVLYPMNAVDTVRNLPRNYLSLASFDKLRAALAPWFTVARVWNASDNSYDMTVSSVGSLWRHALTLKNGQDEHLHLSVLTASDAPVTWQFETEKFTGLPNGVFAAWHEEAGTGVAEVASGVLTFRQGTSATVFGGEGGVFDITARIC